MLSNQSSPTNGNPPPESRSAKVGEDVNINYLLNGQRWQSTIEDYIFFHALEGKAWQGHYDNIIEYVSSDHYVYQSAFAEYITDQIHQRAPNGTRF